MSNNSQNHQSPGTRDQGPGTKYLLSLGYWFSSRSLGLLEHPYITMRAICREHFLRPLVLLPLVLWTMTWICAVIIGRIGLLYELQHASWTIPVGYTLVFTWIWGSVFVFIWQLVLIYLFLRFRHIGP